MRLNGDTPVYPGDPAVGVEPAAGFADAGYFTTRLSLGSHNGTHLDAEGHMIPGGRMLDAYPLEQFRGRGVLLDVRGGMEGAPEVGGADLDEDCIVLLRTGLSDVRHHLGYYAMTPQLPDGLVDLLVARGVKMVGVDAGSIDAEPFPVHRTLLAAGILVAENLVGLSALAYRTDERFNVWALPLNLEVEASPARVLAEFPRDRPPGATRSAGVGTGR
jgi:kynurenine formamidase